MTGLLPLAEPRLNRRASVRNPWIAWVNRFGGKQRLDCAGRISSGVARKAEIVSGAGISRSELHSLFKFGENIGRVNYRGEWNQTT